MKNLTLICLGGGKNQKKLINISVKKKIQTLVLEFKRVYIKNNYLEQIKLSCYNLSHVKKNINLIKKKIISTKIDFIYRSSGPSILVLFYLCKIFKVKRISKNLAQSIYSKSFFSNLLIKKKIPTINFLKLKSFKKIKKFSSFVIKPDAPIIGKKNVFLIDKKTKFNLALFNKVIKCSHNKNIICSDYISGFDVGSFVFIEKKNKKINYLNPFYEKNKFQNNKIKFFGLSKCYEKKLINKINSLTKKIIRIYPKYYGFLSITYRVSNLGKIFPYEINIGLSGDGFAETYFPKLNLKKNPFDMEIKNLIF